MTFSSTNKREKTLIISEYLSLGVSISRFVILLIFTLVTLGFVDSTEGREYVTGIGNPIWAARYTGLAVIFIIINRVQNKQFNLYDIIFIIIGIILIYKTGSRAPLISLFASSILYLWPSLNNKQKVGIISSFILIGLIFMIFSERSSSGATDYSNKARLLLIMKAFDAKFNIYIGAGIGSYNILTTGIDELYYPHNIEIETYIETGLLGLTLLIYLLYQCFRRTYRNIIGILFIYFFINAQFSGDIAGNNMMFIMAQILFSSQNFKSNEKNRIIFKKSKI